MRKQILIASSFALLTSGLAVAAEAQPRSRSVNVQGANGGGFVKQRSISRGDGNVAASRSVRTNGGHGYDANRSASRQAGNTSTSGQITTIDGRSASTSAGRTWGDGSYSGGRTTTLGDGTSFGHSTTATRNADGSVSYSSSRTGVGGDTATVEGTTVPR
ncbi:hypothetical protein ACFSUK_27190 [Sphingobium scionense]|uniref:Endonuclease n=2 Tax=Sphingomonadaceae TaxID=41297 RepID=A0A7X4K706_9SPHN|nr:MULTISPECIES: hypothetical protein [Sphingomonadaceae]MBB4148665.1 hypothetical protein [Sphingobium scionense]MDR6787328.1 hypothetical protein [Sphingomonas sp. BE138]MYL96773.1 hypothetical protein [Novosphingobium silvae]